MLDKSTGASSTFDFVDSAFTASGATYTYYPILKSIGTVGCKAGEYLPEISTSTIVLDNNPNSFGYERRFSDLLDRFTPIDQTVTIYTATEDISGGGGGVSWAQVWKAKVANVAIGYGKDSTVTLNITQDWISRRVATKPVDSSNFPSAPLGSIGKFIPIIFGNNIEVRPIRVDNNTGTSYTTTLAYGTTLGSSYVNSGVQNIYRKDYDGTLREVLSASSVSTAVYSVTFAAATNQTPYQTEHAIPFAVSSPGYLITHGRFSARGSGNGAWTSSGGIVTFKIYERDAVTLLPGQTLGTATIKKSDYQTSWRGATSSQFWLDFTFNKPVQFGKVTNYFLSFLSSNDGSTTDDNISLEIDSTLPYENHYYSQNGWTKNVLGVPYKWDLYGINFADTKTPSGAEISNIGLGHSYITATQHAANTGYDNPDLRDADFIFYTNGLKDDGSGNITGSANSVITRPDHAIKVLDLEWNGSTWTGAKFDWSTTFNSLRTSALSTNLNTARSIAGRTEGETTLDKIYTEICRNAAMKVVQYNGATYQLALWAFGTNEASTATISDEDCQVLNLEIGGTETIVNYALMNYDKRYTVAEYLSAATQKVLNQYAGSVKFDYTTDTRTAALSTISNTIYGRRELANTSFDWLNDSTSVSNMAAYYLGKYAYPLAYVNIRVPYEKYKNQGLMDIVTLVTPNLPAFFGTSADAHYPTYAGTKVDPIKGNYMKRAASYRAQIEEKKISFAEQPVLEFRCRLLLNTPADPT